MTECIYIYEFPQKSIIIEKRWYFDFNCPSVWGEFPGPGPFGLYTSSHQSMERWKGWRANRCLFVGQNNNNITYTVFLYGAEISETANPADIMKGPICVRGGQSGLVAMDASLLFLFSVDRSVVTWTTSLISEHPVLIIYYHPRPAQDSFKWTAQTASRSEYSSTYSSISLSLIFGLLFVGRR